MILKDFLKDIGEPFPMYPSITALVGKNESMFLCRLVWWHGLQNDPDGWIFKSMIDLQRETGLSLDEQKSARRTLREMGIVQERHDRKNHKFYYRVDFAVFRRIWEMNRGGAQGESHGGIVEIPLSDIDNRLQKRQHTRDVSLFPVEEMQASSTGSLRTAPSQTDVGSSKPTQEPRQNVVTQMAQSIPSSPKTPPNVAPPADPIPTPEDIYEAYPLKVGRPAAVRSIRKAMMRHSPRHLLERTKAFAAIRGKNAEFTPHPATWFNQERFNDDPSTWHPRQAKPVAEVPVFVRIRNIEHQIATHPANREWMNYDREKVTPALVESFKRLRIDLQTIQAASAIE